MKLILAIMSNDDSPAVSSALTKENYQVTRLATTGGFLRAGNTTLIVGTDDDKIERAIEVIGEYSRRRTEVVPSTVVNLIVAKRMRLKKRYLINGI